MYSRRVLIICLSLFFLTSAFYSFGFLPVKKIMCLDTMGLSGDEIPVSPQIVNVCTRTEVGTVAFEVFENNKNFPLSVLDFIGLKALTDLPPP